MSQIHRIETGDGDDSVIISNVYNGEKTKVRIDPDKTALFDDRRIFDEWPEACPFLRRDPANYRICCVVHASRPDLCREYGCWRLLVLDGSGKRVGRIMGTRHLATDDPVLRAFWVDHFGDIQGFDDDRWDRTIITVLENNGYRVLV